MRARSRRFREQKWLLDLVISTVGLDWDLLRMGMATAPVGFEGMGDWIQVVGKVKRFDDLSPSFEEIASGREARAVESENAGEDVSARESYLVAYQNERHAPGRMPSSQLGPHWYAMMADWLAKRVRDRQPLERSRYRYVTSAGAVEERPLP